MAAAVKRLRKELKHLHHSETASTGTATAAVGSTRTPLEEPKDHVYLRPTSDDNILHWTALLQGPTDTPYEGGVFEIKIVCSNDYPMVPPKVNFVTKIFHPNVHFRTGEVCLDILQKEWSPAWGLMSACRAIVALLSDADATSPLNCDAGNMVRNGDDLAFRTTAQFYTHETAMFLEFPNHTT